MTRQKRSLTDYCMLLLFIGAILASIKSLFTDSGIDNAYTAAMSYRHILGDSMFCEMWEPHQTSIFLTDILMWLYHLMIPSYKGVILFLQVCGTGLFVLICIPLYRLFNRLAGKNTARLACLFFVMFRAKQTPFPDFANQQIAFGLLALLCLGYYYTDESKWRYLVLSGLCFCLEILSYPSTLIGFPLILVLLFFLCEKKWKSLAIFAGTCISAGICYAGYFVCKIGLSQLLENLKGIFLSDSHSGEIIAPGEYFAGAIQALIWLSACLVLTGLVYIIAKKLLKKEPLYLTLLGVCLFFTEVLMLFCQSLSGIDWTCTFYSIPLFLMGVGLFGIHKLTGLERKIWISGTLFAAISFFSTFLFTDLGLITVLAYMVIGGIVSFLPLSHMKKEAFYFGVCVVGLVIVHRGLVVWGYANKDHVTMVYDIRSLVTSGPSAGIVSDYMTYYRYKAFEEEAPRFITEEDSFLLVTDSLMDPAQFFAPKADIANWSTIDTPIYNETLLDYYGINPEKTPDVVALECWYGTLIIPEDSFIYEWVTDHYEPVGDGCYWRYYRLK